MTASTTVALRVTAEDEAGAGIEAFFKTCSRRALPVFGADLERSAPEFSDSGEALPAASSSRAGGEDAAAGDA
jgi:hypothetical protein